MTTENILNEHKSMIGNSIKSRKTKNKKLWQSIKTHMINTYQQNNFEDFSDDSINAKHELNSNIDVKQK